MSKKSGGKKGSFSIPPELAAHYLSQAAAAAAKDGRSPPNSEAEMKALMSMFVEIMGMSDSEMSSSTNKNGIFMFGSSGSSSKPPAGWPAAAAAAAAAAAGISFSSSDGSPPWADDGDFYDEDDDEEEEEDEPDEKPRATASIEEEEWDRLEQVARDESLEEEERARKAAKRREKRQRKKERSRQEAALKAEQAAQKKRERQVQSWSSRVIAACQQGDLSKVDSLLRESPLKPDSTKNLEMLLLHSVTRDTEAYHKLAAYVIRTNMSVAFTVGKNGRNTLHTACFLPNVVFAKIVLEAKPDNENVEDTCQDSGWSPLHYAVLSGSTELVEALLKGGVSVKTVTNDALTCNHNGDGVTPRELAECVFGKNIDELETQGNALEQVLEQLETLSKSERHRRTKTGMAIVERLKSVEQHGYTPPAASLKDSTDNEANTSTSSNDDASKRRGKKKKKKKADSIDESSSRSVAAAEKLKEDPLVTALLGMGFTLDQIQEAAKACGGMERATADDMVMWILSGGESVPSQDAPVNDETRSNEEKRSNNNAKETKEPKQQQHKAALKSAQQENMEAVKREQEARAAAQRLKAKKEEQRRRNREWNNRAQARQQEEMARKTREEAQRLAQERSAAAAVVRQRSRSISGDGPALTTTSRNDAPPIPLQVEAPAPVPQQILRRPATQPKTGVPTGRSKTAPSFPSNTAAYPPGNRPVNPMGTDSVGGYGQGSTGRYPDANAAGYAMQAQSDYETMGGHFVSSGNSVSSGGSGRISSSGSLKPAPPGMYMPPPQQQPSPRVPPPGFHPTGVLPRAASREYSNDSAASLEETSSQGEIRATARAFVPTAFKPAPQPAPAPGFSLSPVAQAAPPAPGFGLSPTSPEYSAPTGFRSGSDVSRLSRLPGLEESTVSNAPVSSLFPPSASGTRLPLGLERSAPTVTPQSPVYSTTSSVTTGITATETTEPAFPSSIGLGLNGAADGAPTSSLLDPALTLNPSGGGGTSSIWGNTPLAPGPAAGFSSFGMDNGGASSSLGPNNNVIGNQGKSTNGWQAPGGGFSGGTSNGMGSIW